MNHPEKRDWAPPPLTKSSPEWEPPPLLDVARDAGTDDWSVPPLPTGVDSAVAPRPLAKLRPAYVIVLALGVLVAANWAKLPGIWAEIAYRRPSEKWIRSTVPDVLSTRLGQGEGLIFDLRQILRTRDEAGVVTVQIEGVATTPEPLFAPVELADAGLGLEIKLAELAAAEETAGSVRKLGETVVGFDSSAFAFIRQTDAAGGAAPFRCIVQAKRDGFVWTLREVRQAELLNKGALTGQPKAKFSNAAAVVGSAEAARLGARVVTAIDNYKQAVADSRRNLEKRLLAEGRDPQGIPLFPSHAMVGERFSETRLQDLDPANVQTWPEENIQYAINEIYARHGADFGSNKKIADWFRQFRWHKPEVGQSYDQTEEMLSTTERGNLNVLTYARTVAQTNAIEQRKALAAQQTAQAAAAKRAQQQAGANRAQQEAARRQQQQEAVGEAIIGGILNGIGRAIDRR